MEYILKNIASITKGKIIGNENILINNLIYDSRAIIPSDACLFFAIKSVYNDGHRYISELYKKGQRNFIVNRYFSDFQKFTDANFIQVDNTVEALQKLAEHHRSQFSIPVFGITGSNGKTIVKEWLTSFLNEDFNTLQSPKSFNSQIGVPLSVWELTENHEVAVFEAGISKINEMDKLQKIIRPNFGIFTNIGDAHQMNFTSVEQKIDEKLKLFTHSDLIIYSSDYELINGRIKHHFPKKHAFTWGKNKSSDLCVKNIEKTHKITEISVLYRDNLYKIRTKFSDKASIENILTVLSALLVFYPEKIPEDFDFTALVPVEMRLQQIQGKNKCTIINDSYNSDLTSIRIAIDVLNAQNQNSKKTLILSDIYQLGKTENELYFELSKLLKNSKINRLIGVGENICKFADFFEDEKYFFKNTDELISNIYKFNFYDEAILLKGARKFRFEKISDILQLKNHRTVLEINMSALEHNLNYFRELLKPETKIMVMVKAFSYGSGSFEIANFLQRKNVDYLAVAIADEGIDLRKAGINLPILILNPDIANFNVFVENKLEPEIYSFRMLDAFYKATKNKIRQSYPIHIKINTGMNRLGFSLQDIPILIDKLKKYEKLHVESVFSHLVASDDKNQDDFTNFQIQKFNEITDIFDKELSYKYLKHILNSAGIQRLKDAQFDMVRLGIGLYGISSEKGANLLNISVLKTKIVQIINVKAGETIGYSRVGKVFCDSVIATIPIGYADGLNRLLSNGVGQVLINGKYAPIIGNICMDLTMVNVTGLDVSEGDEVIIFNEKLTVQQIANQINTIPYEILTSISQRVKRIYVW